MLSLTLSQGPVLGFTKTDFHFLLLLPSSLIAINQVTEQVVWSQDLQQVTQSLSEHILDLP